MRYQTSKTPNKIDQRGFSNLVDFLSYTTHKHNDIELYLIPISSYKKKEHIHPTPQQPSPYLQARKQPLPHLPLAKSTKCLFLKLGHPHTLQILKFNKSKLKLLFLELFTVKK